MAQDPIIMMNHVGLIKTDHRGRMISVLKDIKLSVLSTEIHALIGPSGSGKSSILRLLNRLEEATSGDIYIEGKTIGQWQVRDLRNKIGFVFQESSLFPGTVMDNILYAPRIRGIKKSKEKSVAKEMIAMVGLEESFLDKEITRLSGGEKQRVNIARTLAAKPEIILLDEPTAALDPASTQTIEQLILNLNQEYKKTIVFVSHNMQQVKRLSHHIAVIKQGETIYQGTAEDFIEQHGEDMSFL